MNSRQDGCTHSCLALRMVVDWRRRTDFLGIRASVEYHIFIAKSDISTEILRITVVLMLWVIKLIIIDRLFPIYHDKTLCIRNTSNLFRFHQFPFLCIVTVTSCVLGIHRTVCTDNRCLTKFLTDIFIVRILVATKEYRLRTVGINNLIILFIHTLKLRNRLTDNAYGDFIFTDGSKLFFKLRYFSNVRELIH